jgi:two-component system nitrate/nitrite sensor histidine kinase NarX
MIYELVTEQAAQLLDCSIACLFHWNGDQLEICHPITYGITEEISRQTLCLSKEDFLGELLSRRTTLVISDTETQPAIPDVLREQLGARALLCLPLEKQGTLLGVLFLIDTAGPRAWTISEIAWAESFVNHVVIALENAQLHQTVERAAMLEERQRIAAAMHDGVAQTLSYLGLQCDALIESEKAGRHATLTTQCHALRDTVNQAVQEARHAIASLTHPPTRTSLQERLTALLDEFKRQQLNVTFNNKIKTPLVLPPETSEQIIKVIQEAITNAQKHAAASQVELQIMQKGELVAATVRDDGVGFDQTALNQDDRGHFGLSIMRARADRINGVLEIDSTPGHGTEVTLSWHHYGNEKMPCRDTAVAQWLTKGWEDGKDQRTARRRPRALS